ncbi:cytosol aminopeptidase family, catalytic domain protein [Mycobacterium xenopi 4042]|uniref:Probable cytosol aminopeptidase n=1 Tax=Mycobacterium xenopi 4042 TaxID=1299334 RepID=X8DD63_MYCXE|nr:cytosol aminopeptidase family, catalytic domain protein [Mycobacterium xenopi 4042]
MLIVPVVSTGDEDEPGAAAVVAAEPFLGHDAVAEIENGLRALGAKGGAEQTNRLVVPSLPVGSVLTVGLGKSRDEWPTDLIRRAAGRRPSAERGRSGDHHAIGARRCRHGRRADPGRVPVYRVPQRQDRAQRSGLRRITALSTGKGARADSVHATAVATAVATARDLVNTPPSHLYPDEFARRAKELGESAGLEVEVLDEKALQKAGYGGVIGVGKGSSRPPRLVRLVHRGSLLARNPKRPKRVALVGKGITFDTGGISIKPAANMHYMTSDMGGAAAVIATVTLAAQLKLPIDVIATVPMAENMPSGPHNVPATC